MITEEFLAFRCMKASHLFLTFYPKKNTPLTNSHVSPGSTRVHGSFIKSITTALMIKLLSGSDVMRLNKSISHANLYKTSASPDCVLRPDRIRCQSDFNTPLCDVFKYGECKTSLFFHRERPVLASCTCDSRRFLGCTDLMSMLFCDQVLTLDLFHLILPKTL